MTLTERAAVGVTALLAWAVVVAYLADGAGFPLAPIPTLAASMGLAMATAVGGPRLGTARVRHGDARRAPFPLPAQPDLASAAAFIGVVGAVLAYLVWLGWPALVPPGGGPDLAHHLLLVDYIERQRHIPRDPALAAAMGEMWAYTPGAHLLAVLAGAWTSTDGFRAVYPVVVVAVALKAGFVFLIARRELPDNPARVPLAVAAVLLMLLPRAYVIGAFARDSFFAQVVGELFAVATWWAIVMWSDAPSMRRALIAGWMGAATFLTWPIWIGPLLAIGALRFYSFYRFSGFFGFSQLLAALGPVAVVAVLHTTGRAGYLAVAGTSGFVMAPSLETIGAVLPALATTGLVVSLVRAQTRTAPALLLAIVLQASGLYALARSAGADTAYMALKMVYLAIYPMAVLGAIAVGAGASAVAGRARGGRTSVGHARIWTTSCWLAVFVGAVALGRTMLAAPRPAPVVSADFYDAGRWTRDHLPLDCVDYLVPNADTAYWLHLAVLGHPRASARTEEVDRESPRDVTGRWIEGRGRRYGIADVAVVPREVWPQVRLVQLFGRAAVIEGSGSCPLETPGAAVHDPAGRPTAADLASRASRAPAEPAYANGRSIAGLGSVNHFGPWSVM